MERQMVKEEKIKKINISHPSMSFKPKKHPKEVVQMNQPSKIEKKKHLSNVNLSNLKPKSDSRKLRSSYESLDMSETDSNSSENKSENDTQRNTSSKPISTSSMIEQTSNINQSSRKIKVSSIKKSQKNAPGKHHSDKELIKQFEKRSAKISDMFINASLNASPDMDDIFKKYNPKNEPPPKETKKAAQTSGEPEPKKKTSRKLFGGFFQSSTPPTESTSQETIKPPQPQPSQTEPKASSSAAIKRAPTVMPIQPPKAVTMTVSSQSNVTKNDLPGFKDDHAAWGLLTKKIPEPALKHVSVEVTWPKSEKRGWRRMLIRPMIFYKAALAWEGQIKMDRASMHHG